MDFGAVIIGVNQGTKCCSKKKKKKKGGGGELREEGLCRVTQGSGWSETGCRFSVWHTRVESVGRGILIPPSFPHLGYGSDDEEGFRYTCMMIAAPDLSNRPGKCHRIKSPVMIAVALTVYEPL